MRRSLGGYRRLAAVAILGIVTIMVTPSSVIAAGSGRVPDINQPVLHSVGDSRTTLAQAPPQLRVAARSALITLTGPVQQAKLTASDGASNDLFGFAVAISSSTAIFGAFNKGAGVAYVFVRSGTTWSQQAELTASDG